MPILMFHAVVAIARLLTPCAFPAALQRIATAMAVLRIYARMTASARQSLTSSGGAMSSVTPSACFDRLRLPPQGQCT